MIFRCAVSVALAMVFAASSSAIAATEAEKEFKVNFDAGVKAMSPPSSFCGFDTKTAVEKFTKAVAIARRSFPPNDPRLADALEWLGQVHGDEFCDRRDDDRSIEEFREALTIRAKKKFGTEARISASGLVQIYMRHGAWQEAAPLAENLLTLDSIDRTMALAQLAECYCGEQAYSKSIPVYKEIISLAEKEYGANSAIFLVAPLKQYSLALHKISDASVEANKIDQRIAYLRGLPELECLSSFTDSRHPSGRLLEEEKLEGKIVDFNNEATQHFARNQMADCISLLSKAIALNEKSRIKAPAAIYACGNLAAIYQMQGRFIDAARNYDSASRLIGQLRKDILFHENSVFFWQVHKGYAATLYRLGDKTKAEREAKLARSYSPKWASITEAQLIRVDWDEWRILNSLSDSAFKWDI